MTDQKEAKHEVRYAWEGADGSIIECVATNEGSTYLKISPKTNQVLISLDTVHRILNTLEKADKEIKEWMKSEKA